MGELWRDLVEILRRRPLLWLPVLLADLLGYLVNLARNGAVRAFALHQTAQHSVLGGAVVHGPMSSAALESTTIFALLLSWFSYLVRILLYTNALVATAALVAGYTERASHHPAREIGPALGRYRSGILDLALRSLAVYAVAALFLSWLSPWMQAHGFARLLHDPWFGYGLSLLVLLVLAVLLPPVVLRVLSGRVPGPDLARQSQQFAFALAIVASLLAAVVGANSRELAVAPLAARYPLEIVGSLVVALPYVLLFTGLALLARRLARETAAA